MVRQAHQPTTSSNHRTLDADWPFCSSYTRRESWFDKLTNLLRQAQEPIINMKGYTYILQVSDGRYYVGSTENLEKRLAEHQRGEGAMFTKAYLPVKLVYTEEYPRIEDAFRREAAPEVESR